VFDEDDFLPLSALQHLVFCERRFALVHIEGLWADNASTVAGAGFHASVDDTAPRVEARGDLRICRRLQLRCYRLGLAGKADAVEFRSLVAEGVAALDNECQPNTEGAGETFPRGPCDVFPVEYKSGRLRHERCYEVQLCAQALCLEEMLGVSVTSGAIYYGKTRRRVNVLFDDSIRNDTEVAAMRLHELFGARKTPAAIRNARCGRCSMARLCLPTVTGGNHSVKRYLRSALQAAMLDVKSRDTA
jgi:CRISPR-associated exonuclease Cas4